MSKKRYRVTGPFKVGGVEPGGIVYLSLTPEQEHHLISVGHIRAERARTRPERDRKESDDG